MKDLQRFRGKNKPTSVLSFPFDQTLPYPKTLPRPLGEIYLAPDYIRAENSSLTMLALHGLLHLLGYTHGNDRDKIMMERLEKKILHKIS